MIALKLPTTIARPANRIQGRPKSMWTIPYQRTMTETEISRNMPTPLRMPRNPITSRYRVPALVFDETAGSEGLAVPCPG
jgi:hypothetical protein